MSSPSSRSPLVVVVGAGLAGLHAAWRLHGAGVGVIVMEARDRVGGRTWSQALPDGTIVERGGEFIGPGDDVLRGLVAELDLELISHGFSFDRRPTPDRGAPTDEQLGAFAAWTGARAAALQKDISARDALPPEDEWPAGAADALRRLETSLTVPLDEVSARRTFTGTLERYDPAVRVKGGNQRIAADLARRLRGRVWRRMPVVAVRHSSRGATVVAANGHEHHAAAVVLALPLPLLLELELHPGLPRHIRRAAARTRFGDAVKLHVPLALRPEPAGIASPDAHWWCWTSRAADGGSRAAPALSAFAGGAAAVQAIASTAALALRPDVVATGDEPLLTHWGAERWTRGSYSAPGVGLTAEDDVAWTRPWGSVVLAGEHTAGDLAATMNGAAASGARAAQAVLDVLERRSETRAATTARRPRADRQQPQQT